MAQEKKVTVMLPTDLVDRALKASGTSLTATIRKGLVLIAAKDAYKGLLKLKGKFDIGIDDLKEFRKDRDL
ncbi:MAG: hypothetical protein HY925_08760 [Elusimicrobia bacterium]|nr:hypothetical protein [Elusimicrobiota bacterium]